MTTAVTSDFIETTESQATRIFAIIPAAGLSRRMGEPKLLLPWGSTTVLGHLLTTLNITPIVSRIVVTRRADAALQREVARQGGLAVSPVLDPEDMRTSVEFGLREIAGRLHPQWDDGWLMLPGDCPLLTSQTLHELLRTWLALRPKYLVPTHQGRRGHPLMARWDTVTEVFDLPADVGLNHLLRQSGSAVVEWPMPDPSVLTDLDCPEDYRAALQLFRTRNTKAAED